MLLYTYFQKAHQVPRREYQEMLKDGAIFLNKEVVEDFKKEIEIGDIIQLQLPDGNTFSETIKYFPWFTPKLALFHKPKGYVCSKDDKHNKTIYELLPESRLKDFWYIGRLDKDSTGLLLLTNDSSLVDRYENPFHDIHKVYEVQIDKPLKSNDIKKMRKGILVTGDGERVENQKDITTDQLKCVWVTYKKIKDKHFVIITLNEGKNRHIRRLLKALWYKVKSLQRLKVDKRHLGNLKPGKWKLERVKIGKVKKKKDKKKKDSEGKSKRKKKKEAKKKRK